VDSGGWRVGDTAVVNCCCQRRAYSAGPGKRWSWGKCVDFISSVSNDDFSVAFHSAMTRSAETEWTSLAKTFMCHASTSTDDFRVRPRASFDVLALSARDDALVCKRRIENIQTWEASAFARTHLAKSPSLNGGTYSRLGECIVAFSHCYLYCIDRLFTGG